MVTVVAVLAAAAAGAGVTLLLTRRARARSNARFDALVLEVDGHLRAISHRLERVVQRVEEARARGVGELELTLGFHELLDGLVSEAAARTGADAVAARVDGPGASPVIASFGAEDGAALLGAALGPPDSRPFRALTINWTHGPQLEGEASAYKSAMVVPITEAGVQTGAIVAYAREAGAFRPDHVRALQALADEAAPALTNARRFGDAEQRFVTDAATGIRNRRGYEVELEREVARARRTGRPLSLLLLHVENGDTIAHSSESTQEGVLPELASLLSRMTRATDTLCRPRDLEFAILLPETKGAGARRFYSRLRAEVGSALSHVGPMTFSAGLVEWRPSESSQSLAARAAVAVMEGAVDPSELAAPPEPAALAKPEARPPDRRRAFLDLLTHEVERAHAEGHALTLLVLDAEPVAAGEDTTADDVEHALDDLARRLSDTVEEEARTSRIGPQELAAVLAGGAMEDAEGVVAVLRESLRTDPPRKVERIELAAGITGLAADDDTATILGRAEQALSQAKQAGDGTVVVATANGPDS